MGQAKNRGTKEERMAKATPKVAKLSALEQRQILNRLTKEFISNLLEDKLAERAKV